MPNPVLTEVRRVRVELTQEEFELYCDRLAHAERLLAQIEDEGKAERERRNELLKDAKATVASLCDIVIEREHETERECELVPNIKFKEMVWRDVSTYREYVRRPMDDAELKRYSTRDMFDDAEDRNNLVAIVEKATKAKKKAA